MLARIVVIEDDVYMREELIDMLKKAGYDAVPLPAFENVVSQLAELSPDLILLDKMCIRDRACTTRRAF